MCVMTSDDFTFNAHLKKQLLILRKGRMQEMHELWLTKWQMGCCSLQLHARCKITLRRQSSGVLNFAVAASQLSSTLIKHTWLSPEDDEP